MYSYSLLSGCQHHRLRRCLQNPDKQINPELHYYTWIKILVEQKIFLGPYVHFRLTLIFHGNVLGHFI